MRVVRGALVAVALACLAAGTTPARAGYLKCTSQKMTMSDFAPMKHAATRAAGVHVLDWHDVGACMNPGWGRAWIQAKPEPQADGSRLLITVWCERGPAPWTCVAYSRRWYAFTLALQGREQQFDLEIPENFSVEDARKVTARAFDRATTLTTAELCGAQPGRARTKQDDEAEARLRQAIAVRDEPMTGDIRDNPQGTLLSIDDEVSFLFSREPAAVDEKKFDCWGEIVVVT